MIEMILFGIVVSLVIAFAMTNGFLDGGGIVSTVIMTRTMEPFAALMLVALCEVAGVSLFGHAVMRTLARNMFSFPPDAGRLQMLSVLFSAVFGALLWNTLMWRYSLPSSSSHALLGGLLGATWQRYGLQTVSWPVFGQVLAGLAVVPLVAAFSGFGLSRILYWMGQYVAPTAGKYLRALHLMSLAGIALVHGSNDGQKGMALILLAMVAAGMQPADAALPSWAGLLCGAALGFGVLFGSRRTIQTVGKGFYRMQDHQGLCAQSAAMVLVGASSLAGFPMSTSHVMSSAVLGAGAAVRPRGVRWDVAGSIGLAWLFTIPAAGLVSAFISYVVSKAI